MEKEAHLSPTCPQTVCFRYYSELSAPPPLITPCRPVDDPRVGLPDSERCAHADEHVHRICSAWELMHREGQQASTMRMHYIIYDKTICLSHNGLQLTVADKET